MEMTVNPSAVSGVIAVPGSKSHTIRAIAGALLSGGVSELGAPLASEDTASTLAAAVALGATVEKRPGMWRITGCGGKLRRPGTILDLGNSGTGLFVLCALAAAADFPVCFDGDVSLRKRALEPELRALAELGAQFEAHEFCCPLTVCGPLRGGRAAIAAVSSQFLTALLFAAPLAQTVTELSVLNLNERPYVEITLAWLRRLGISFECDAALSWFRIPGGQRFQPFRATIPADFSTAAFPLGAGIVAGAGEGVTIKNLDFSDPQGDKAVFAMLETLGARLEYRDDASVRVVPGGRLHSGTLDLNATPDALPLLAAVVAATPGITVELGNVAHARLKETDRIACMNAELTKMGARIVEKPDGMMVTGARLTGARLESHGDHRIAMALTVAALSARGASVIAGAEAASVTYPDFFRDFRALGAECQADSDQKR